MPGPSLDLEAHVLLRLPATENFHALTVFCPDHGVLRVLQRTPKKIRPDHVPLDLFDHVSLRLEHPPDRAAQPVWFIREARVLHHYANLARHYDALTRASLLARLIVRNPVPEESRPAVATLLHRAFSAFATGHRPDVVHFKALYCLARDEGYPLKQHWLAVAPAADCTLATTLLANPAEGQTAPLDAVSRLLASLENFLRNHTEILLE